MRRGQEPVGMMAGRAVILTPLVAFRTQVRVRLDDQHPTFFIECDANWRDDFWLGRDELELVASIQYSWFGGSRETGCSKPENACD